MLYHLSYVPIYMAGETRLELVIQDSKSCVLPITPFSNMAQTNGFEPLQIVLETIVLPITPSLYITCP